MASNERAGQIGVVTHGSLSKGVTMKLGLERSAEDMVAGTFVVIQGKQYDFFSLITDVTIDATNENILLYPPESDDHLLRRVVDGMGAYTKVELRPRLMMSSGLHAEEEPQSVKTIPAHFASVSRASEDDVARVFGHESHGSGHTYFEVGSPLGMEGIPLCINLERFVERSNAIFGKTGTGKTYLTRILLAGLIKHRKAVNLIFDMHSEYGTQVRTEGGAQKLLGLKDLFPDRVQVYTLDPQHARDRQQRVDREVYLYADQIEPSDLLPLQATLRLPDGAPDTCYAFQREFHDQWLAKLLDDAEDPGELANRTNAHEQSIRALRRKLSRFRRFRFFSTESSKGKIDVLHDLMTSIEHGKSVILEFGNYTDLSVYLLVANVVTRRIRSEYVRRANRARPEAGIQPPPQLLITLEEAHRFLSREIASETPFGAIAREMRKFYVSLLVVDQRPSSIDEEVLSQIGTKLVCQLNNDKDIAATLVGERDSGGLRNILASIDANQQALLMGHALPMPIVARTRTYDHEFFDAMMEVPRIDDDAFDLVQG